VDSGQWTVVSGQSSVDSRQWTVVSGQLSVDSCQWTVVSGQLSVDSRQWTVVSGQSSVVSRKVRDLFSIIYTLYSMLFKLKKPEHCSGFFTVHCRLPTDYCVVPAFLLSTVDCPLTTA
jgi:hypothetical protein